MGKAYLMLLPSFQAQGGSRYVDCADEMDIPYPPRECNPSDCHRISILNGNPPFRQGLESEIYQWAGVHSLQTHTSCCNPDTEYNCLPHFRHILLGLEDMDY